MGMGNFACDGFTIGYDKLKKMCPEQVKAVEAGPLFERVSWGQIAKAIEWQDEESLAEEFWSVEDEVSLADEQTVKYAKQYVKLVKELSKAFKAKTEGLDLFLSHYNEDEGDRYDSVDHKDGCIFMVGGMMDYTPAGKKFKKIIKKNQWVQFG
jgi:hypothetical protein